MYEVFISDTVLRFVRGKAHTDVRDGNPSLGFILQDPENFVRKGLENKENITIYCENPEHAIMKFASRFRIIRAAGCLVESADANFLMIFRRGFWDLPKGKIDPGESDLAAALRETIEECGNMDLKVLSPLSPTFHMYLLKDKPVLKRSSWFRALTASQPPLYPQLEEGISEALWLSRKEVESRLPLAYPAIASLIRRWI